MNSKQNEREALGAQLKAIREAKNLSKYRVAKDSGLSINSITYIENGSINYTIDVLANYLEAVNHELNINEKES
jgi:transcriptional regulator with XRE-family HTH domain